MQIDRPSNELSKLIEHFPNKNWDWYELSRNPNITIREVLTHPYELWNWECLSANPGITMKDVLVYPNMPWRWDWLSQNPEFKGIISMRWGRSSITG